MNFAMAELIFGMLPLEHWAEYPADLDQTLRARERGRERERTRGEERGERGLIMSQYI